MRNLAVQLKPSRYRRLFLLALISACIISVLLANLPWWLQTLLLLLLVVTGFGYRRFVATELVKQQDQWRLALASDQLEPVRLVRYYSAPWLMILSFVYEKEGMQSVKVVVWPDSLLKQQFKYLRVALRQAIL